ncbi:MAG: CAP domain-containing protein [Clostridiales bacterium]|nr:CAP domain-containing protein [Clostridiales bacterium]
MKKQTILTMAMVLGLAGSTALQTEAAQIYPINGSGQTKGCVIVNGQICDLSGTKDILKDLCDKLQNGGLTNCPTITLPDCNLPGDIEQPEDAQQPDVPEVNQPDVDVSEPEVPGTDNSGEDTQDVELSFAKQVAKLVNEERAKAGLPALEYDTEIASVALVRANEITASFSHTRPDGRKFSTVLTDNGIRFTGAGENIAWGQKSPEQVMEAWMNSDGHRANILDANFNKIGVGHYQDASGRNYWVQLFVRN